MSQYSQFPDSVKAALDSPGAPTPPLDDFLEAYRLDENLWWRMPSGHLQNLFDEALDRIPPLNGDPSGT